MYFAAGTINDLVAWFNSSGTQERILCLLVPHDPKDVSLLEELFDARGLIGPQLGDRVAFCLFSSPTSLAELRAREAPDPDVLGYLFIPGMTRATSTRHWQDLAAIDPMLAHAVPSDVREEVLRRSQSIAEEIVEYFDLDERDLPCIMFVAKGDPTPFVIPTTGAADLKLVRQLFEDLGQFATAMTHPGMLSLSWKVADQARSVQQRDELLRDLQVRSKVTGEALAAAANAADPLGFGDAIRDVRLEDAHQLFRYLGLPHKDKRPLYVDEKVRAAARGAMLIPEVHTRLRAVVAAGKQRHKVEIRVQPLDRQIRELQRQLTPEAIESGLRTIEDQLNALCHKYEKKFRRAKQYMAFRKFLLLLTGAAKVVEDAASLGATLDKAARSLP
ncbi:MAG: hypothetical protein ACJ74O_17870 [Frankiaceae bacterium]